MYCSIRCLDPALPPSKPDLARKALLATIEQGSDYAPLGFVPITAQVEVDQIVAEQVATETEKATASIQETAGGSVEDFKQSMQIAAVPWNCSSSLG